MRLVIGSASALSDERPPTGPGRREFEQMTPPQDAGLIATVTMNPTIDIAARAETVQPTHKLRTYAERQDPGGGGINVTSVLTALGCRTRALLLAGGSTGRLLDELLADRGIERHVVPIGGRTRTSHAMTDELSGHEYRFISQGPAVTEPEWSAMLEASRALDATWLIASGSLPPGVPEEFYAWLANAARAKGTRFVLDTSGPPLRAALSGSGPALTLVKSSLSELESIVGRKLPDAADQEAASAELVRSGRTEMFALTLGEEGATLTHQHGLLRLPALDVVANGTVGAGDSFLAGMVMALSEGRTPEDALAWGIAAGGASVMMPGTASLDRLLVERLRRLVPFQAE